MSIQAIKGVEVGEGFAMARRRGTAAHDEIFFEEGELRRHTDRAGGTEGGMTIGGTVRVRAAMKPLATLKKALRTVDLATGEPAAAFRERTDVCSVPAAAVVGEAVVAWVLAEAVVEKFGGDTLGDCLVVHDPGGLRGDDGIGESERCRLRLLGGDDQGGPARVQVRVGELRRSKSIEHAQLGQGGPLAGDRGRAEPERGRGGLELGVEGGSWRATISPRRGRRATR